MMGRTTAFPSQFSGKNKKKKRRRRGGRRQEIAEGNPENPRADAQRSDRERRPGSFRQTQGGRRNGVANSADSSADSSRATQPVQEEARVEEPRRRGGEVTSRRDKETGGDGAARQRGSRKGGGHTTTLCIYGTHIVYGKSGAESLGGTSTRCQSKTFYIHGYGTWTSNFRIIV